MAPAPTPLDLHWRLFGIDFRVQPSFWLFNLFFGYLFLRGHPRGAENLLTYLGLWAVCAFVSILFHELGHVVMSRLFGVPANIVLYSMGGLAIGQFDRLRSWQRILVSLAGPAAGFFLCFLAWEPIGPGRVAHFNPVFFANHLWLFDACAFLFLMNLFWNLFNLIPIIPLDGGMVMREVVALALPRQGLRVAYGISFLCAGTIVIYSLMKMYRPDLPYPPLDPLFNAIMFGLFAFGSFSTMRALEAQEAPRRYREYEEKEW